MCSTNAHINGAAGRKFHARNDLGCPIRLWFKTEARLKRILPVVFALFAIAPSALAQDYPNRVITLVSPFPPGGPSDTTARMIVGPMSKALGQQIIVENLPGAGGVIGSNKVAKATPDGYIVMV